MLGFLKDKKANKDALGEKIEKFPKSDKQEKFPLHSGQSPQVQTNQIAQQHTQNQQNQQYNQTTLTTQQQSPKIIETSIKEQFIQTTPTTPVVVNTNQDNNENKETENVIETKSLPKEDVVEILKKSSPRIVMVQATQIVKNPYQPRTYFDAGELESLKDSIKENGLIQPLAVRKKGDNYYELIAGERRLRACLMLEMEEVPCYVLNCDDKKSSILALTENIQRNNLSYFEEAKAYLYMLQAFNMTQTELSLKFGKSQSAIANKIRLLKFSKNEQNLIIANHLTERQCRALLKLEEVEILESVILHIKKYQFNTKQTEDYIEKLNNPPKKRKRHLIIKDIRCFINTVEKAIDIMNESGVNAKTQKREVEGGIEYVIKIPTVSKTT